MAHDRGLMQAKAPAEPEGEAARRWLSFGRQGRRKYLSVSREDVAQIVRDLDGSPLSQVEQDGDHLSGRRATLAIEHGAGQRQGGAADFQDARSNPHARAVKKLAPEVDLDPNDRDRERAPADGVAHLREEGDAGRLEEPVDRCVIAVAQGVEIREPDAVLDPVAVERRLETIRGGHGILTRLAEAAPLLE